MKKFKNYLLSISFPVIIGTIVGLIISKFIDYSTLIKPFFAPPSIVFPIVWTILYIIMGISYGILKQENTNDYEVKAIYFIQLFVNALWSIFFFVLHWRLFSFFWIILLDILVFIMIIIFKQRNKLAGILQYPYFIWVLFATILNLSIYLLN